MGNIVDPPIPVYVSSDGSVYKGSEYMESPYNSFTPEEVKDIARIHALQDLIHSTETRIYGALHTTARPRVEMVFETIARAGGKWHNAACEFAETIQDFWGCSVVVEDSGWDTEEDCLAPADTEGGDPVQYEIRFDVTHIEDDEILGIKSALITAIEDEWPLPWAYVSVY